MKKIQDEKSKKKDKVEQILIKYRKLKEKIN